MSTNVALLITALGFELYTYTSQLLVQNKNKATFVLKNTLFFSMPCYFVLAITIVFLIDEGIIAGRFYWWFVGVVIFEHLSQEIFRMYLAIEKTIFANLIYFLRAGTWSWVLSLFLYFEIVGSVTMLTILSAWFFGALASVVVGLIYLPSIKNFFSEPLDIGWLKKALKFSGMILLSTVFLKIIEFSDRYFINYFLSKQDLGVYTFYFQLSNLINVVIFTLFISFLYPKIMRSVLQKDRLKYEENKRSLNKNILKVVLTFALGYYFILPYILEHLQRPQLRENQLLLLIMLLGVVMINLSYASHYFLITEKRDSLILKITILTATINVILNILLLPIVGIYGSSIALLVSGVLMFLMKNRFERKILNLWS